MMNNGIINPLCVGNLTLQNLIHEFFIEKMKKDYPDFQEFVASETYFMINQDDTNSIYVILLSSAIKLSCNILFEAIVNLRSKLSFVEMLRDVRESKYSNTKYEITKFKISTRLEDPNFLKKELIFKNIVMFCPDDWKPRTTVRFCACIKKFDLFKHKILIEYRNNINVQIKRLRFDPEEMKFKELEVSFFKKFSRNFINLVFSTPIEDDVKVGYVEHI